MPSYYPMMVNLENKNCVVVGGGNVATRKIASLLEAKAIITVVSPTNTEEIKGWSKANLLHLKERAFESQDVKGAFLVIAATNSSETNLLVYKTMNSNQLINIIDQPELGNFIVPTVLNRGKLSIAISTSGSSPSLAQKIKSDLEKVYDNFYEEYLEFLDESRRIIKSQVSDSSIRYALLKELLNPIFLELTRKGKYAERKTCFHNYLAQWGVNKNSGIDLS